MCLNGQYDPGAHTFSSIFPSKMTAFGFKTASDAMAAAQPMGTPPFHSYFLVADLMISLQVD